MGFDIPGFSWYDFCDGTDCQQLARYFLLLKDGNMDAKITIDQFVGLFPLRFKVEEINENPNIMRTQSGDKHYRCRIRLGDKMNRRQLTVLLSKGSACEYGVTLAELLSVLAIESSLIDAIPDVEEWCYELGDRTVTRQARIAYRAGVRQAAELKKLLGDHWYDTLLYHTEPM
jgi:hypothetical protein